MSRNTVRLRHDDLERVVRFEDDQHAAIDGVDRRFHVTRGSAGQMHVSDGDRMVTATVATDGTIHWVFIEGTSVCFESSSRPTRSRAGGGQPDTLAAPMPATVIQVHAAVGATVSAGDVLVVVEAMKMELPIRAPEAGTVTAVHCREGDLVQPGIPLVELDS